jgi:DNA repair exonuclease SbcCD ATPase subunit
MLIKTLSYLLDTVTEKYSAQYWREIGLDLKQKYRDLQEQCDRYDAKLTSIRVALDAALVPGVVPYPLPKVGDPPLEPYLAALQAGGRCVSETERIAHLAEARDYAIKQAANAYAERDRAKRAANEAENSLKTIKYNNTELKKVIDKERAVRHKFDSDRGTALRKSEKAEHELKELHEHIKNFAASCVASIGK